ncbi:MAG TPA: hypothetical protein VFG00_07805 [Acidothermaceae bacterium]|nr:hypothetical protein [Acidothermaceae bacterium]
MTGPAISAVAFCPHPPLLRPGIATGIEIETQSLRSACNKAIDRVIGTSPHQLLVLGTDGPRVDWQGFAPGLIDPELRPLPLSLQVGAWLLSRRTLACEPSYLAIGPDGEPVTPWPELPASTGLLVMGDGSARRSLKGPGYLDERAEPFDQSVVKALADGAPQSLADLDLELAEVLLAAGAPAWVAAAKLLRAGTWHGDVLYADAPYGVMYTVATWLPT